MIKKIDELRETQEHFEKIHERIERQRDFIVKRRDLIIERGEKNSEILSGRVRVISLAVLGTCWAFIIGQIDSGAAGVAYALGAKELLWPVLISVVALLCDLLQYVAYQLSATIYIKEIKVFTLDQQKEMYRMLRKDWKPRWSARLNQFAEIMFWAKSLLSVVAAIWFLVILLQGIRWR